MAGIERAKLTVDERLAVLNQHIKSILVTIYNAKLSINQELQTEKPNKDSIKSFELTLADAKAKLSILDNEFKEVEMKELEFSEYPDEDTSSVVENEDAKQTRKKTNVTRTR
jgi:hypothetical protein